MIAVSGNLSAPSKLKKREILIKNSMAFEMFLSISLKCCPYLLTFIVNLKKLGAFDGIILTNYSFFVITTTRDMFTTRAGHFCIRLSRKG